MCDHEESDSEGILVNIHVSFIQCQWDVISTSLYPLTLSLVSVLTKPRL